MTTCTVANNYVTGTGPDVVALGLWPPSAASTVTLQPGNNAGVDFGFWSTWLEQGNAGPLVSTGIIQLVSVP